MTITLTPELERALTEQAHKQGITPEDLALDALREKYNSPVLQPPSDSRFGPRDKWEQELLSLGKNYGVSLSNEAVSSEALYD